MVNPQRLTLKRNFIFYLIILGITLFVGVLFIYSSLFAISDVKEINPDQKFQTYIIALILGFFGAIISFMLSDTFTKSKHIMIAIFTFLNLILVIVLFTEPIAGVKRWMNIGPFQFQPSELAKLIIPAFLAFYYSQIHNKKNLLINVIFPILACGVSIFLVFLEPDLSSAIIITMLTLITMFLGIRDKKVMLFFIVFTLIIILFLFIFRDNMLQTYQISRLTSADDFQSERSRSAIENGGLLGTGPFAGEFKYYVPESYSDFIVSVIGEEWGKFGIVMVVTLFFFLSHEFVYLAYLTKDYATFIFCGATASWIFIQVVINTLVGLGVPWMPVTGVTLPMVSYGNTSMIVTLISIGWGLGLIYHNSELVNTDEEE